MTPDLIRKAFAFPNKKIVRRHGPAGYTDYGSYKPWLRDEFSFRCVYCLECERWNPDPEGSTSADHFLPQSLYPGLINDYDNLLYSCLRCNRAKVANTGVLNPCETVFAEHLQMEPSGVITGLTPEGNIHTGLLKLNESDRVKRRSMFMAQLHFLSAQADAQTLLLIEYFMGYPDDLPDLGKLRPPANSRPNGIHSCAYNLRKAGKLVMIY